MKLLKPVELVLGLAASGSLMLVLSSGAYAANSGIVTTSQTTNVAGEVSKNNAAPISTKSNEPGIVTISVVTNSDSSVPASDIAKQNNPGQPSVTTPAANNAGSAAPNTISATPAAPGAPTAADVAASTSPIAVNQPASLVQTNAAASAAVVPQESAAPQKSVTDVSPVVSTRTMLMELQPRITATNIVAISDLAAMVPTASAHDLVPGKAPVPSSTGGVFSKLTAELAASVVPHAYFSPTVAGIAFPLSLIILIVTSGFALRFMAMSFGDWIRRGGFAHAARSDVAAQLSSLFATPLILSYVTAVPPTHSSFLMVSNIKRLVLIVPNAIERRN
jgi:hypothetical protein